MRGLSQTFDLLQQGQKVPTLSASHARHFRPPPHPPRVRLQGGGLLAVVSADVSLTRVSFLRNGASSASLRAAGGGAALLQCGRVVLSQCAFEANAAEARIAGGGRKQLWVRTTPHIPNHFRRAGS